MIRIAGHRILKQRDRSIVITQSRKDDTNGIAGQRIFGAQLRRANRCQTRRVALIDGQQGTRAMRMQTRLCVVQNKGAVKKLNSLGMIVVLGSQHTQQKIRLGIGAIGLQHLDARFMSALVVLVRQGLIRGR